MRLDCQIKGTACLDDPVDHRTYTEYHIEVSFNNEKTWMVSQKYKAFCQLHEGLVK